MKKIIAVLLIVFIFACGNTPEKSIEYKSYNSADKSYLVEIPTVAPLYKSLGSIMTYVNEKDHLFITVQKSYSTPKDFSDNQRHDDSFTETVIEDNDSIYIYRQTRGAMNFWTAYDCVGSITVDGVGYIVTVSSDVWSKDKCRNVLVHIMSSIKNK